MWTLFCNVCINFLNSQIWKEIILQLNVNPTNVTLFPTDFSFQNLVFGKILNFQWQKSFKNQYLPHSESKSYQINFIKSSHQDLSSNTKSRYQFLRHFQLPFNLIVSEEIIQYSRTFAPQVQTPWNQADAPLLLKSFPKTPRTRSEASWFGGSHWYKQNKTNQLPSFIDRLLFYFIVS